MHNEFKSKVPCCGLKDLFENSFVFIFSWKKKQNTPPHTKQTNKQSSGVLCEMFLLRLEQVYTDGSVSLSMRHTLSIGFHKNVCVCLGTLLLLPASKTITNKQTTPLPIKKNNKKMVMIKDASNLYAQKAAYLNSSQGVNNLTRK